MLLNNLVNAYAAIEVVVCVAIKRPKLQIIFRCSERTYDSRKFHGRGKMLLL